jgi:hypothetical protein
MESEFLDFEPARPPPDVAAEIERRDLLALLPAVAEVGDLQTLLWLRRRLRELGRSSPSASGGTSPSGKDGASYFAGGRISNHALPSASVALPR